MTWLKIGDLIQALVIEVIANLGNLPSIIADYCNVSIHLDTQKSIASRQCCSKSLFNFEASFDFFKTKYKTRQLVLHFKRIDISKLFFKFLAGIVQVKFTLFKRFC